MAPAIFFLPVPVSGILSPLLSSFSSAHQSFTVSFVLKFLKNPPFLPYVILFPSFYDKCLEMWSGTTVSNLTCTYSLLNSVHQGGYPITAITLCRQHVPDSGDYASQFVQTESWPLPVLQEQHFYSINVSIWMINHILALFAISTLMNPTKSSSSLCSSY